MKNRTGNAWIDSPAGKLLLIARETGLTHLLFADRKDHSPGCPAGDDTSAAARILTDAERQLREYFAGKRYVFDLPLAPAGTEFQLAVWRRLRKIPYGHTTSYGDVARDIEHPRAARAVGAANGANPISIIVPCHRVVGSNRHLTGFGGGMPTKRLLLELEGVRLKGDRLVKSGDRHAGRVKQ